MIKFDYKKNKGFSIGEVILSVFILGVTMLTILSLYSQGLRSFQDERDSVIAAMLAQEGVELARNIRDNNWAKRDAVDDTDPGAFDLFDVSSGGAENDCRVSYDSYTINADNEIEYDNPAISCDVASSDYVLNISGNFYTHRSGTPTKFRRKLVLDYLDIENLIVKSFVSWDNANPPDNISECTVESKCVFSQTTLTEWGTGT
ncbi:MAG: hypothetical protein UR60_C0038G0005 [Candidatus Moranbacteria bacterium GW2011_GWF2_34_56]|nr:MAG: hypothetical protein UR60_C0038G0005 [Candidatus Moranbacteria bacterium GW2011_GWF2_34_56]HBI17470.1 hypothetical protein [Candidatus Moranbacteria bacterium]